MACVNNSVGMQTHYNVSTTGMPPPCKRKIVKIFPSADAVGINIKVTQLHCIAYQLCTVSVELS